MRDVSLIIHLSRNVVWAIICACIFGCSNSACLNDIDENSIVTDEMAILASQKSLERIGLDMSNFEPVPYDKSQKKIYAHSNNSANNGYVLWHKKTESTKFEYSVSIKRVGSKVYCDAGKTM